MNQQDLEYINNMINNDDADAIEPDDMDWLLEACEFLDAEAQD